MYLEMFYILLDIRHGSIMNLLTHTLEVTDDLTESSSVSIDT